MANELAGKLFQMTKRVFLSTTPYPHLSKKPEIGVETEPTKIYREPFIMISLRLVLILILTSALRLSLVFGIHRRLSSLYWKYISIKHCRQHFSVLLCVLVSSIDSVKTCQKQKNPSGVRGILSWHFYLMTALFPAKWPVEKAICKL